MNEILLIGAGGHARACIDVIEQNGSFAVAGLVDNNVPINQEVLGYPIIGTDSELKQLHSKFEFALVSIGQIKSPAPRMGVYHQLKEIGYILPTIVSPTAYVSRHATVGEGTIVLHGAIVNANSVVGCNCIVNSRALIEHDAVVGDHCHISTGALINGQVNVGEESFIGSGVVTKQAINIEQKSVIGAGSFLSTNV